MTESFKARAAARDPNWLKHQFAEQREIATVRESAREFEKSMGSTITALEKEIARLESIIAGASIPERRAVHVSTAIDGLSRKTSVVCDDGSVWMLNHESEYNGWKRLPGIPQPGDEMRKSGHGE